MTTFLLGLAREPRRATPLLILGAAILVIASYGYLLSVSRSARAYLGDPITFGIIVIPYVVCAIIWWRPHRRPRAASLAGVTTAGILFIFAAVSSAWRTAIADEWSGDMQGIFVVLEAGVATLGVIVVSVLSYVVYRWTPG